MIARRHRMRRWSTSLLAVAALLAATAAIADTDVVVLWQRGCPHCRDEIGYLERASAADPRIRVHYFELRGAANRRFYGAALAELRVNRLGVPLTVIGTTALVGYRDDASTGRAIAALIAECERSGCASSLVRLASELGAIEDRSLALAEIAMPDAPDSGQPLRATTAPDDASPALASGGAGIAERASPEQPLQRVRLPWFGDADLTGWSLPLLTVTLAAIDGFNPCAMWVLVFLIGLLLGQHDPARRWLLGGTFLMTTALVYYMLIAAWLNVLLVLGVVAWLRIVVGLVALGGGAYYAYGYWRDGAAVCRVADAAQRGRVITRLRAAVAEPRFIAAALAIAALAIGVNFIELLCSAGLPAVYTQVLALTPMPLWEHHLWLALYVLVFLADDLAIFATAMLTLQLTGAAQRYAHHVQLAGALVLGVVGVLLISRPEWLRFG